MTDEELKAIEDRANEALPGPWSAISEPRDDEDHVYAEVIRGTLATCARVSATGADARFIAHARDDVPALVAEIRRLQAEVRRLEDAIDEA